MNRLIIRYVFLLIFLIFFQGVLLTNVTLFNGYAHVFLYTYFILSLPFEVSRKITLPLAFLLGLSIDLFYHTPGIHTSATLTAAFFRPMILSLLKPRDGFEADLPGPQSMGWSGFILYGFIFILVHQLWLFILLYFSTPHLWEALGHALVSSLFTMVFVVLLQLFNQKPSVY
jgi:hypothetical protein